MKRLVVLLVALFAVFVFIRDFSASASASEMRTPQVSKAQLIP